MLAIRTALRSRSALVTLISARTSIASAACAQFCALPRLQVGVLASAHRALTTSSGTVTSTAATPLTAAEREARVRKMMHRSGQRGMLELDLILGGWAKKHLPACTDAELNQFAVILKLETPDVLKMLIGQIPIAEKYQHFTLLHRVKQYVQDNRPDYSRMQKRSNQ